MAITVDKSLLAESLSDLHDDFEELEYLVQSILSHLYKFLSDLQYIQNYIRPDTKRYIFREGATYKKILSAQLNQIKRLKEKTIANRPSSKLLLNLTSQKEILFDLIRSQYPTIASLITSIDWQSPSFTHSLYSQAGIQTGKIIGTINDYKRDTHLDEEEYEKLYLKEYIDAPLKLGLKTLLTVSGMAAFTTILNYLVMDKKIRGKVLVGNSSYFQYKQLLDGTCGERIIWVNEMDIKELINLIETKKPDAVFIDSLCNAKNIPLANLEQLIEYLTTSYKKELYLVIDNTCLSIFFQPFNLLFGKGGKIHLITFESLMKYVHLGLDKVTGGIIVAKGKDAKRLFEYRKHSGTNIPDASVYSLPTPDRKILENRLLRFQRNVLLLSTTLSEHIENNKKSIIEKIVFLGLPHHEAYQWSKNLPFQGSFFNIEFKEKNTRIYKKFINLVVDEAKKRKVQIVGGTSFGLNNTRIYLTSLWTDYGEPFIRVSVGTENRYQIEIIKKVFIYSIDKIKRW